MTVYSVLLPFMPRRPEQVLPYAALVDWTNAERLWQGQSMVVEPSQGFTYAAGAGFRVPTGLGVGLMPLRHPFQAAQMAQSLVLTTGHSFVAGFGPGARSFQASLRDAPYASPLTATREYLTIVRSLLDGDIVDYKGEYFSCRGRLHNVPRHQIELGLGVLRPGMARLAGEIADTAITWLTSAPYLRDTVVPALREGAEAVGRPIPRLTVMVGAALRGPDRDPATLALAGSGAHMQGPHYIDMLRRSGIEITGEDQYEDAKRLVAGGAFLYGDLGELSEALNAYREVGAGEIILNLTGAFNALGAKETMDDLKRIFTSLV